MPGSYQHYRFLHVDAQATENTGIWKHPERLVRVGTVGAAGTRRARKQRQRRPRVERTCAATPVLSSLEGGSAGSRGPDDSQGGCGENLKAAPLIRTLPRAVVASSRKGPPLPSLFQSPARPSLEEGFSSRAQVCGKKCARCCSTTSCILWL